MTSSSFYILNKTSAISQDYFLTGFILLLGKDSKHLIINNVKHSMLLFYLGLMSITSYIPPQPMSPFSYKTKMSFRVKVNKKRPKMANFPCRGPTRSNLLCQVSPAPLPSCSPPSSSMLSSSSPLPST